MKERIVNQIIQGMLSVLNNAQTAHLQKVLAAAFSEVEVITVDCSETKEDDTQHIILLTFAIYLLHQFC